MNQSTPTCVISTEGLSVAQLAKLQESQHNRQRSGRRRAAKDNRLKGCRTTWPMVCTSLGVNPDEIAKVRAEDARRGLKVDYTPDGDPIFTGPRQYKQYAESYGYYAKNGGYGDPQRTGRLEKELEAAGVENYAGGMFDFDNF